MKRKALIILTIAILAFAMIPAIGAGADAGVVKIVTPDQLANPSGTSGSSFDKLSSAAFVSDTTGSLTTLEDAGGTLFVVVEDNDSYSNALTDYYAYFTDSRPTAPDGGGNAYSIDPGEDGSTTNGMQANWVTNSLQPVALADLVAQRNDSTTNDDESAGADDLQIGDKNRSGAIDHGDLIIETGCLVVPVAGTGGVADTDLTFTAVRDVNESNAFIGASINGKEAYLSLNVIPDYPTSCSTADTPPTVGALRITFASADVNNLNYTAADKVSSDLVGESRVEVRSTSGSPIRVPVSEKNLDAFTGASVNKNDLDNMANESRDSGVFVGMFGVIENDYKDAITAWSPTPTAEEKDRTEEFTVIAANATPEANQVLAATPTGDPLAVTTAITLTHVNSENTLKEGSVVVTLKDPERNRPKDNAADPADSDTSNDVIMVVTPVAVSTPDASTGVVTITVTTAPGAGAGLNDDGSTTNLGGGNYPDIFVVTYTTISMTELPSIGTMLDIIKNTTAMADRDDPFYDFCQGDDGKECAERDNMVKALEAHMANLGLMNSAPYTDLADALIGVEHGDTLTVRYSDANPSGARTRSAEVDLVAPTIGSVDPADSSYINDDDFSVFFSVTDEDSGIPEDAHDVTEQTIRADTAYVEEEVTHGQGDVEPSSVLELPDEAELDVDAEINDGERYELEIDVGKAVGVAEGTGDATPMTLTVQVKITAYDLARNMSTKTYTFVVDNIDPELQRAITGWGVKSSSDKGSYVLVEGQRNSIVLVFDDAVQGDDIETRDIDVVGQNVQSIMWLDNSGSNTISVGDTEASMKATDLDFDAKTATSSDAADVVDDLDLDRGEDKQDARHLLFLTLETDLDTDDRPDIEIDGGDLADLAGNMNRSDHEARPADRLAPVFTITVEEALSNNTFTVQVTASESLERTPRAWIANNGVERSIDLRSAAGDSWALSADRDDLNLTASNGTQDGIYKVTVEGVDEAGNESSTTDGSWEFDTRANGGMAPDREGFADLADDKAAELETNDVIFLAVDFAAEADEYTGDTKKKVSVTGLSLDTLDDDGETVSTMDLSSGTAQSANGVRHVIALSELALGSYSLDMDYADEAGNTGSYDYLFKVVAPKPVTVDVVPGWSLVSLPGTPQDKSIAGVLAGSAVTDVWSLNNETKEWEFARMDENGEWMGNLSQIVDGRAYFVRSTTFEPIEVLTERFSPQRTPAQYTVIAGWNGIGYTPAGSEESVSVDAYLSSLGGSGWGMIRTWDADATPPQYETYFSSGAMTDGFPTGMDADGNSDGIAIVEAGKGYLLFATRNGVIGG